MKANIKFSPRSCSYKGKIIFDEKNQLFKAESFWKPYLNTAYIFNYIYEDEELIDMFVENTHDGIKVLTVETTVRIIDK
jgi:hypothetical protein